jgi:hypothetical protein
MARIRDLNGLPNEVVQRYISTSMFYSKGYMPDWIAKRLKELNVNSAELDIFKHSSSPQAFITKPMSVYFDDLKNQIEVRLLNSGFETNYINQARFKIHVSKIDKAFGEISIQCVLIGLDNRSFRSKIYNESFYPIPESLLRRIIKKFS